MELKINKALVTALATGILVLSLSTSAMAVRLGFGISGGATYAEVSGTETLNAGEEDGNAGATQTVQEGAGGILTSAYAQIIVGESYFGEGNGFALGYEHVFGSAKFQNERGNIYDYKAAGDVTGKNKATATLENINTIFIETPGFTRLGLYLKGGFSEMDVITEESLITGGSYGNSTSDGPTVGFGFKKAAGKFQVKTEFNYTDWDTISITNVGDGDLGTNKVVGTPENWTVKFGIGYLF